MDNNIKRGLLTGLVILFFIGAGVFVVNQQSQKAEDAKMAQEKAAMKAKEDAAMEEKDAMKKDGDAMEGKDDKMMNKNSASRYVEYSKAALDQTVGNRRVLFFYANWCSTCKPTDANLKENINKIPEDVTVIRVNFNDPETDQEEKDLAKKYGIIYQHTFVQIDSQGKEVAKWNGGQIDELLSKIN